MEDRRSRQLAEIIRLSHRMLAHARAGEWARVAELEAGRRELVLECFRSPTSAQDAPGVAALIKEILHLNHKVTELAKASHAQLGSELQDHRLGKAACAAYAGCAR